MVQEIQHLQIDYSQRHGLGKSILVSIINFSPKVSFLHSSLKFEKLPELTFQFKVIMEFLDSIKR